MQTMETIRPTVLRVHAALLLVSLVSIVIATAGRLTGLFLDRITG